MILTNLLTPWSRVLLLKLTGFSVVKKFPAFYGRFIIAFSRAHHLSLFRTRSIQEKMLTGKKAIRGRDSVPGSLSLLQVTQEQIWY
jgi:hypothetical protein